MANIFPNSITELERISAMDDVFADSLGNLDVAAVLVHLTEQVPADALDSLIHQWGLVGDGLSVANATEAVKRHLLREAAKANAKRGTIWAIRFLFAVTGIPDIEVVEADELNIFRYYDGTWFYSGVIPYGFEWQWAEYAIRIYVFTATVTVSEAILATMDFALKAYAPARCRNIGYTSFGVFEEPLDIADTLTINII